MSSHRLQPRWSVSLGVQQLCTSSLLISALLCSAGTAEDPKATFEHIYTVQAWGGDGGGSGLGSSVSYTAVTRKVLFEFIESHHISSIIDAPCGAFVWMPVLLEHLRAHNHTVEYYGFDVVSSVIERNIARHQNETTWHFELHDLTKDALPRSKDLILSRDALQHLSFAQVRSVLMAVKEAEPKFFLVGSYPSGVNTDIRTGDYFSINLMQTPFSLWPHSVFSEQTPDGKHLLLYTQEQIKQWQL